PFLSGASPRFPERRDFLNRLLKVRRAEMSVTTDQRRTAVPKQAGDRPFRDSCHGQPRGESMSKCVPCNARESQLLDRWQIVAPIEVPRVRMLRWIPTRKTPHRLIPGNQTLQESLRLFIQPNVLHPTRLSAWQGQNVVLHIDVFPTQTELLKLPH